MFTLFSPRRVFIKKSEDEQFKVHLVGQTTFKKYLFLLNCEATKVTHIK